MFRLPCTHTYCTGGLEHPVCIYLILKAQIKNIKVWVKHKLQLFEEINLPSGENIVVRVSYLRACKKVRSFSFTKLKTLTYAPIS